MEGKGGIFDVLFKEIAPESEDEGRPERRCHATADSFEAANLRTARIKYVLFLSKVE